MKKVSIKAKVTIWIVIFMIMISFISLFVVTKFISRTVWTEAEMSLREEVEVFETEIEILPNGGYIIDEDSYHEDQVIFSIYSNEGNLLSGSVPSRFPVNTVLKNGVVQRIQAEGSQYLTYDMAIDCGDGTYLWLRGILYTNFITSAEKSFILIIAAVLPILIIIAALGGYFITKRAFAPVEEICRTADEITTSGDLSKRVILKKSDKEFYKLSIFFNKMLDAVEQAFEKEKQFTADASHELRTPVSVILSESEYALLPDIEEEERLSSLNVILEQAKKMSALISQMLMIAWNQKENIVLEPVNVSELLKIVLEGLEQNCKEKNIKVSLDIEKDIYMDAEETTLIRIFTNLMENAIYYGVKDGHIWVKLWREDEGVKCSIKDDGIGIAEEHHEKIFNRFYRVDKARTAEDESHSGLGLSMVKMLLDNMESEIKVQSKEGEGAEFIISFTVKN